MSISNITHPNEYSLYCQNITASSSVSAPSLSAPTLTDVVEIDTNADTDLVIKRNGTTMLTFDDGTLNFHNMPVSNLKTNLITEVGDDITFNDSVHISSGSNFVLSHTGTTAKIDTDGSHELEINSNELDINTTGNNIMTSTTGAIIMSGATNCSLSSSGGNIDNNATSGSISSNYGTEHVFKTSGVEDASIDTNGIDLVSGKEYRINGNSVINTTEANVSTQYKIGGGVVLSSNTLGSGVIHSSLQNLASNVNIYDSAVNGSPSIKIGNSTTESLQIESIPHIGTALLDYVEYKTFTSDGGVDSGAHHFNVDGTDICKIRDSGMSVETGKTYQVNGVDVLSNDTLGSSVVNSSLENTNSAFNITDTTQSTTSGTGSLIVAGGVGIVKDVYCDGTINGSNVSATNLQLSGTTVLSGSTLGSSITASSLTSVGTLADLSTASFNVIDIGTTNDISLDSGSGFATLFKENGVTQGSLSGSGVNVVTGNEYRINNTKVLDATSLGSGVVSSSLTSLGTITSFNAGTGDFSGQVNCNNTIDSSSISTGSVVVDGGVGIAKNLYIGDSIHCTSAGNTSFESISESGDKIQLGPLSIPQYTGPPNYTGLKMTCGDTGAKGCVLQLGTNSTSSGTTKYNGVRAWSTYGAHSSYRANGKGILSSWMELDAAGVLFEDWNNIVQWGAVSTDTTEIREFGVNTTDDDPNHTDILADSTDLYIGLNTEVDGNLHVTGNITYIGTISDASDERLKKEINDMDLDVAYNVMKKFRVKTFKYVDKYVNKFKGASDKTRVGLIAQEVEQIPEVAHMVQTETLNFYESVREEYKDDITGEIKTRTVQKVNETLEDCRSINVKEAPYYLLASQQKMSQMIEGLQATNASLEARIASLEAR